MDTDFSDGGGQTVEASVQLHKGFLGGVFCCRRDD